MYLYVFPKVELCNFIYCPEKIMENKPVSCALSWPLNHFLPSFPALTSLHD